MLTTLQELLRNLTSALTPWIVLAPWEQGIRIRFGRNVVLLQPGFNWVLPGVDKVSVQTTRLRVSVLPLQTLSTRGGRTLILCATVSYAIEDVRKLFDSLHHAEDTIRSMTAVAVAESVLQMDESPTPEAVAAAATQRLDRLYAFGLRDITVCLTDFAFVRCYRLVNDQKWGGSGDQLSTVVAGLAQVPR